MVSRASLLNTSEIPSSMQGKMTLAALKLNEVEQALTRNTQLRRVLFDCYWLVSWAAVIVKLHLVVQELGHMEQLLSC